MATKPVAGFKERGGIELLDVEILLIETKNGEAPGDLLVMSECDARQAELARSDASHPGATR